MKKIHLIGNAHLDYVWQWQWQEGFAEVMATFRSALDRMNEFPEYCFTSACSFYYMWIEKSDPEMFDEIVKRVKEGRWNVVGGWCIQPDCNIPGGESFARHALISQRYFKEKFGITAKTGYNVDSFGHNGSLPKILKNSGMTNYVFMRPMPHEKELPQSLFKWESADGSAVTTYRIPFCYNIESSNFELFEEVKNMREDYDMMAFFGIGNHGGGPTVELLDKMKRELDESYIYSTPDRYFETVKGDVLPTVKSDLQFHAKGCYSACTSIKKGNRYAENAMLNAEKFSVLSKQLMGTQYPEKAFERGWKNILANQFHDILGGCSVREAYEDSGYVYGESMSIAMRSSEFAIRQISWNIDTMDGKQLKPYKTSGATAVWTCDENIGTPVVVFNPLAHPVKTVVTTREVPLYMTDNEGTEIPWQRIRDSKTDGERKYGSAFVAEIPAFGYSTYRMYLKNDSSKAFENEFICSNTSIENQYVKIEFDEASGELKSIFDKIGGKELLSSCTETVFVDETPCDTWAHDVSEFKNVIGKCEKGFVKLIENGPVRAVIRSEMSLFNTTIVRDYIIEACSGIVHVKAKIDFHEKHKMLKFKLPANVSLPRAHCEIPYGFTERPTDGTEQPCGSWTSVSDDSCGLVVANDSKYSFDVDKNVLSLTVMRGAIYLDHFGKRDEFCEYMDQGEHRFEYSIYPFESFSGAEKIAQQINNKARAVIETFHRGALDTKYSGIDISENNIVVTAIKKHEDSDAFILRCYEAENKDTDASISMLGTSFKAHFGRGEVKTFIIKDGNAEEAVFMEWKK